MAIAPPAVLMGVSFVTSSLWVPRYVLVVVPAVCLSRRRRCGRCRCERSSRCCC